MEEECAERRNSKTEQFIPKKNHVTIIPNTDEQTSLKLQDAEKGKGFGKRTPHWVHVWPQVLASSIALGTTIQAGINLAFSSILIDQLQEECNSTIECNSVNVTVTREEASWLASAVTIGTPVGALMVGPVMDLIGRKTTCVLSNVPVLCAWILTYTARNTMWPFYVARALAGFGGGMTTVAIVYTAEISHSLYRPMLLCLNSVFVAFGVMMTNVLGVHFTYKTLAILFGLHSIFSFSLCLVLPESPNWLVTFTPSDKRTARALEELQKLNRPTWLFQEECKKLKETLSERKRNIVTDEKCNFLLKTWKRRKDLCDMSVVSPLLILIVLFVLQQLSGVYVIIFFSVSFFEKIIELKKYTGVVLLGVLRFVMSIIAAGLSRCYGRRILMITSSLGMAITCGLAAAILSVSDGKFSLINLNITNTTSIHNNEPVYDSVSILTVGLILCFMCFGSIGHLVIPWTLISELLPNKARAMGSGFMICFAYILMFANVQTFLTLKDAVGISNILFVYALVSFLTAPFTYFYIPETFNKTFNEISKSFKRNKR